MQDLDIRPERSADTGSIRSLTEAAFRGKPYADGDEQDVIERLRSAGALTLSLVAERGGEIVGHIAFSPATDSGAPGPWHALGPVSVLPAHQSQGIGKALIEAGLAEIQGRGSCGCILTGNPAYYQRFGFEVSPQHAPAREPGAFFMLKRFAAVEPTGSFAFHPAFHDELG